MEKLVQSIRCCGFILCVDHKLGKVKWRGLGVAALLHPALFYSQFYLLIKNCQVECVVSRKTDPVKLFSENLFKPLISHLKIMENKT